MAKMQLPPGFKVTLVASEPTVINPTSFTFDDQGRIWVTESMEYPRESSGPGHDRIKILESSQHDGHFDKATVYKDDLNIPAGIVLGNDGVYVTNSPDVLYLQGKGKVEKSQTLLTGFGRADRHELPNSLTWGPDGWLYGMNGVFNGSRCERRQDLRLHLRYLAVASQDAQSSNSSHKAPAIRGAWTTTARATGSSPAA